MNNNKLLLIEDDLDSAYHLKEFLEDSSFEVDSFETVTDAISNIKFHPYSLILLDINLPDFQGFEVLKFLNKYNSHIPTIVISAYSSNEYKLLVFKLVSCDYVCKPIVSKKNRNERSLDYHIRNIRKKIGDDGSNPSYLVTEYGVGYKLNS